MLLTMLAMAVCMILFEVAKQICFSHITLWHSHFLTIIFSTVIAGLVARIALGVNERTAELKRRQWKLEDFLENATEGMHWVDGDGRIIWANQSELDLLGYMREEYVGHQIAAFHADEAVVNDIRERLLRGETLLNYEARLRCKDGSLKHVLINSNTLVEDGKFIHTRCFTRDITDRKHMDEELKRSLEQRTQELQREVAEHKRNQQALSQTEHLFRSFMDGLPDMVYFKDKQSRFIRANQAIANRFGHANVASLLGKTDFDFFSTEHASAAYEGEQEIIRTGRPLMNIEEKETWPGRPDTWVSTTKLPLRDESGKIIGIFGISRDITEHKSAEEQIREQARLLDLVHDAVIVCDIEDRILYWNASAEHIYGWTAQEVAGQKTTQLLHTDAPKNEEAKKITLEKGEWRGEFDIRAKNGQVLMVEARWTLVCDSQGNPKSILGISTDITKRKKLEAQTLRTQRMESLGTLAGPLVAGVLVAFASIGVAFAAAAAEAQVVVSIDVESDGRVADLPHGCFSPAEAHPAQFGYPDFTPAPGNPANPHMLGDAEALLAVAAGVAREPSLAREEFLEALHAI